MGKSLPSTPTLQQFTKLVSPNRFETPKQRIPISKNRFWSPKAAKSGSVRVSDTGRAKGKKMEKSEEEEQNRTPLSQVVSECVKRWFQDTLKEAKAGDSAMQVLVGQMYYSGYGVPRDAQKGQAWINRASKSRSVWKVSNKQPGYNASDSDSDELKGDAK